MGRGGRGGRSHGHSHSHSHGIGHRHHYSRGRGGGGGPSFEASMDMIHNNPMPPTFFNGVYTFAGS